MHAAFAATDDAAFMAAGVPNLVMLQDDSGNVPVHHTAADTPGNLDAKDFAAATATAAGTAYLLATRQARLGRRLSEEEIRDLMDASGIEPQWRATGIWPLR